jgi:GTP-binding protein
MVAEEGRALVIAVNKWGPCRRSWPGPAEIEEAVRTQLPQVAGVAVVALSALSGRGPRQADAAVIETARIWNRRIPTAKLNRWLEDQVERHPPPAPGGRRIKLRYMTQANARPPILRHLLIERAGTARQLSALPANGLRESFGALGHAIRIHLRKPKKPLCGKAVIICHGPAPMRRRSTRRAARRKKADHHQIERDAGRASRR